MSTAAMIPRHPLGLPAGSIRSVLTLMIVGITCLLIVISPVNDKTLAIPPFLIYLLFLLLGSFFAAHGSSIAPKGAGYASPLYLPQGTVRLLILVILAATVIWKMMNNPLAWNDQLSKTMDHIKEQPTLPIVILAAFFAGEIIRFILGGTGMSPAFQDIKAWIAIIAGLLLLADSLLITVVNPSLETTPELHLAFFESILAGIIAFYFAVRS